MQFLILHAWHITFSAAVYFYYKRKDIAIYRAMKVLYIVCFALTHPNLSKNIYYIVCA